MAYKRSLDKKKDLEFDNTADKIEDVSEAEHAQHLAELSSIEATAASKAAWLISITFAVGRFVVGIGVGSAAMVVPLYISELAPAKYRERMIAFNNMSVTFGQFLASGIGAGFAQVGGEGSQAWRATVGIGAAPAILLGGLLFLCPESPRQLLAHGKVDEASTVLTRIYPTSTEDQRRAKIHSIEMSITEATQTVIDDSVIKALARIITNMATFRAVFTACTIMAIFQLSGFNTLMYYSATLFKIVGFNNATAVAITVSATNTSFFPVSFAYTPIDLHTLEVQNDDIGWPGILPSRLSSSSLNSTTPELLPLHGSALIPMEVRAVGAMLNTVTFWSTNIIIASTFLTMMKGTTPSGAFGFYAGICFVSWLFVIFCFPEVKGMALENIRQVFEHGFGVRYARRWQKENKQLAKINAANEGLAMGH
ncbi:myo-inositol transporter [Didymella keratinophila]|nr:myo-inositol transporter [Didymella keratinophila]